MVVGMFMMRVMNYEFGVWGLALVFGVRLLIPGPLSACAEKRDLLGGMSGSEWFSIIFIVV